VIIMEFLNITPSKVHTLGCNSLDLGLARKESSYDGQGVALVPLRHCQHV
jgi:hypothetical protein